MRARYSAYATGQVDYILETRHPRTRPPRIQLDPAQRWLGLKVIATAQGGEADSDGTVEFVARYKIAGRGHRLHEVSQFTKLGGKWRYLSGEVSAR